MPRGQPSSSNPTVEVAASITVLRGQRVILDSDLAALYGSTTKRLNEQVKRNANRFPDDFIFRLTSAETASLIESRRAARSTMRSQIATASSARRNVRFDPFAFTEHGAIMAATVLNTPQAIDMSVYVVRAFVQLRQLMASNKNLAQRLDELEARLEKKLNIHDDAIAAMFASIRQLMVPAPTKKRGIGFTADIRDKT